MLMLNKVNAKSRLAIALLLCGFVFAVTLLPKAIGDPVVSTSASPELVGCL